MISVSAPKNDLLKLKFEHRRRQNAGMGSHLPPLRSYWKIVYIFTEKRGVKGDGESGRRQFPEAAY